MFQTDQEDNHTEVSLAQDYENQQQTPEPESSDTDDSPESSADVHNAPSSDTASATTDVADNPLSATPTIDAKRLEETLQKLEDCLAKAEPVVSSLADNLSIFEENIRNLDMNRTYFKSDLDRRESLQEQMKKLSHHLENTTTYYYNQQNDLPKKIEKSYEQLVQKHSSKYQKMLQQVAKIFEEESGNTKLNYTYVYINAAFLFLQTCILLFFLR